MMPWKSLTHSSSLKNWLLLSHILTTLVGVAIVALSNRLFRYDLADEVVVALFGLLSIIMVSILTSQTIIAPLQRMARVVKSFSAGDLSARIPEIPIPELNHLGRQFNLMAEALQTVEQRRRQLTSDMAHELRSPITVIHGYLEMMKLGITPLSPTILAQMQQESTRLIRLVDDLLELSRVESGHLLLHQQSIDISLMFQTLTSEFANASRQANCQLKCEIASELPLVYADLDRLKQILVNLISNAITYTPNGTVILRAGSTCDRVWIAIEDNGIGIAPENITSIFERFWRADPSRDSKTGGSGIGLAITKQLIDLHGSHIEVESHLGEGSIFQFSLPIAQASQITDR